MELSQKIVITGASSFIGRQLVPLLSDAGHDLLLVERDSASLQTQYASFTCCNYDDARDLARGFDKLFHLDVLSNTANVRCEEFERVNVGLLGEALGLAMSAHIPRFVNVTSFHALSDRDTPYTRSRRRGLDVVNAASGIEVLNLFLPAVYGDEFAGKLLLVTRLPKFLREPALTFFTAMAPSVHVKRVAQFLISDDEWSDRDVFLANPQDENIVFRVGKALIDILFVFGVVGVFGCLLLIVWLLIPLDSRGPGIFTQTRISMGGKPSTVYKFRTMKLGSRQAGTHEMTATSVTRLGAFLRKTKLDELPQVVNIILGNISLTGPRPCLPVQTQLIAERKKRGVYHVRPGITGLSQINNVDMSDPAMLSRLDARYIAQRSLPFELKIIFATLLGSGSSDKIQK